MMITLANMAASHDIPLCTPLTLTGSEEELVTLALLTSFSLSHFHALSPPSPPSRGRPQFHKVALMQDLAVGAAILPSAPLTLSRYPSIRYFPLTF